MRYGVRGWRKAPGFTTVVVLTMALGIAANTTVFSVINTLFLNPLPLDRPAVLVIVRTVDAGARSNSALPISHANLETWSTQLPLFARLSRSLAVEGREERDRTNAMMTIVNAVDVDYFATMRIAVTRGRDFTDADRDGTLPVAIVNQTLAARSWPNVDPIGRRFRLGGDKVIRQVVGLARTANYETLGEAPQPCVYLPLRQKFSDAAVLYVRTEGDPAAIMGAVQRQVRRIDHRIEVDDVRTIQKVIRPDRAPRTVRNAM